MYVKYILFRSILTFSTYTHFSDSSFSLSLSPIRNLIKRNYQNYAYKISSQRAKSKPKMFTSLERPSDIKKKRSLKSSKRLQLSKMSLLGYYTSQEFDQGITVVKKDIYEEKNDRKI